MTDYVIFDFDEPSPGKICERAAKSLDAKSGTGMRLAQLDITWAFSGGAEAIKRLRELKNAGPLGRAWTTAMSAPPRFWEWICGRSLMPTAVISHLLDVPSNPAESAEMAKRASPPVGIMWLFLSKRNDPN